MQWRGGCLEAVGVDSGCVTVGEEWGGAVRRRGGDVGRRGDGV